MRTWFLIASVGLHAVAVGAISYFGSKPRVHHQQQVAVVRAHKAPPPPKPPPPPQPKRVDATPPPQSEAPKSTGRAIESGLTLGNGPGIGGVAIGPAKAEAPSSQPSQPRSSEPREPRQAPPKRDAIDACDEPDTRPRPSGVTRVEYSDQARADGLEGRIQVVLRIGDDGAVTAAELVSGIEPGLDAYVLSILKTWKFTPATHCGRPVAGSITWAQRFELGD